MPLLTREHLRRAAPDGHPDILDAIAAHADAVFTKAQLTTPLRLCGFLGVALEETGGLRSLVESLKYSAERAHEVFPSIFPTAAAAAPFVVNEPTFAEKIYGHRMGNAQPGDGWRFRGQGLIQITGRDNFALLQQLTGLPLLAHPELVVQPEHMLECAVALFVRYPNILSYCDEGHYHAVWALVGSGRATGRIINLPAHEAALAAVMAAIPALGIGAAASTPPTPAMPVGRIGGEDAAAPKVGAA